MKPQTFWDRLARAIRDRSFIIGSILVIIFLLTAILGPEVAPHNPYLRDRVQTIDGQMQRAPFPPSDLYPMGTDDQGRDMLSMLLHGARQTLVTAFVAMMMRILLGLLLGTMAGWWPGSWLDQAVTTLTEFLAAVPGLVLAILIVFAVGIRRGQVSFIVALSLVGWGEVAQIVRSHVMTIRNKLYILASRAIGLSSAQAMSRHVLPNLLSTLLALAALEMGGVLLLLGELGFVHVFVGGGGVYADDAVGVVHYFDVPDWGAMLGTSWRYFRSLPWLPLAPALAFFVAILGFNLFGYGLQRFIEKGRFHPSGWSVLRFFVVIALLLFGARTLLASTGVEAQFTDLAEQFNVERAWGDITYLSQPELEGRPPGPGGGFEVAGYIARQFNEAGLTTLTNGNYFQRYDAVPGLITTEPTFALLGPDGEVREQLDEAVSIDPQTVFGAEGVVEGELKVVMNVRGSYGDGVVPRGIMLLPNREEGIHIPYQYTPPKHTAVLYVVPDDELGSNDVAPPYDGSFHLYSFPCLLIKESVARQLLAEAGLDLDELTASAKAGTPMELKTGLQVRIEAGLIYDEIQAANVIGYFPAADNTTEGERILVAASYTGPIQQEDGILPGADDNASGVAVMLEVARLWRDLGFEPKRTVVFAAFDERGGRHFVNHSPFPTGQSDKWTAVVLQGVGAGEEKLARLEAGTGLARAFDQSTRRFDVRTKELDEYRFFFTDGFGGMDPTYSGVVVTRPGDDLSNTPADTLEHLDPQLLAEAGRAVSHYLMVLSSR